MIGQTIGPYRILEKLGDTDKAIDFYTRFLDLWQEADPALQPYVAEARRSLDRLLRDTVREPQ